MSKVFNAGIVPRHALHVVLYEPEIPPNTGNIARLCAATTTELHLIEPLGFSLDDKYLKRAGLDYWPHVKVVVWPNFMAYRQNDGAGKRLVATSSRQGVLVHQFDFDANDAILLGPETRGLPSDVVADVDACVRIPIWGKVRSLNLSTAAGILLYHAFDSSGVYPSLLEGEEF